VDEGPEATTGVPGISIRLLVPGDDNVVRGLATYDGPGDPEALLADPRTRMLVAFERDRPVGFVLAPTNGAGSPRRRSSVWPTSRASAASRPASSSPSPKTARPMRSTAARVAPRG
jgi:hypothetical protein